MCLPPIKPKHIGDAVHPGSDGTEYVPLPRRHVISVRPCSTITECACHCSSPCRTAAHGADGVRRTPRYDRGIPCGSSRSTVLRTRFARVNAERRRAVSNADRLNVADKYLSDVERPLLADIVAKVPKGAAANFPPKNETSDNRRSIGLQTRYKNRL